MDFEDLLEPEIAAAAAVVAAIASPQVRNVLRRGAVYGLAGLIVAGDAVSTFAKGVGQGVQAATAGGGNGHGAAKSVPVETAEGTGR